MATGVVRLRETGLILAFARAGAHPCVLVAQDRAGPTADVAEPRLARRRACACRKSCGSRS